MNTKETAVFLHKLAEAIRHDVHDRKSIAGKMLEDYALELDPPVANAPTPPPVPVELAPPVPMSAADHESANASTRHAPHGHAR
jgi:hypothetical protein